MCSRVDLIRDFILGLMVLVTVDSLVKLGFHGVVASIALPNFVLVIIAFGLLVLDAIYLLPLLRRAFTIAKRAGAPGVSLDGFEPALMSDPAYGFTSAFYLCSRGNSPATRPPVTLPFNSPPSLCRGVRSRTAPLYGLGWRSSYAKILHRHPVDCLASVSEEAIIPLWVERGYMDRFDGCVFHLHSTQPSLTYWRPT
jgi:hypothetical protein